MERDRGALSANQAEQSNADGLNLSCAPQHRTMDAWLLIADWLTDDLERAALALAEPRVGLLARRRLASSRGPLLSLAFHIAQGAAVNEALLRLYVSRQDATAAGCELLSRVSASKGLGLHVSQHDESSTVSFSLLAASGEPGPLLRVSTERDDFFYEGRRGEERMVRAVKSVLGDSKVVQWFEGERGEEEVVRARLPSGQELHLEAGRRPRSRSRRAEQCTGPWLAAPQSRTEPGCAAPWFPWRWGWCASPQGHAGPSCLPAAHSKKKFEKEQGWEEGSSVESR
jgi:hypothetical protein